MTANHRLAEEFPWKVMNWGVIIVITLALRHGVKVVANQITNTNQYSLVSVSDPVGMGHLSHCVRQNLRDSWKNYCKILQDNALFLQKKCKILARNISFLQESGKIFLAHWKSCTKCLVLELFYFFKTAILRSFEEVLPFPKIRVETAPLTLQLKSFCKLIQDVKYQRTSRCRQGSPLSLTELNFSEQKISALIFSNRADHRWNPLKQL